MSSSLVIPLKLCVLSGVLYGTFHASIVIADMIWPPFKTFKSIRTNPNHNLDAVFIILSLISTCFLFSSELQDLENLIKK